MTSDIQCSWLHCSDGREWDRERLQCVTASPVASTTPSVAVRRSPPVASTSLETRTRRSTTSVAKTSDISRPATSTPVRPSSRWDTPDEGGGSDTSVMLIVAVTTSLFVLLVLTIVGLVKWCKRAPSHLPRPTPGLQNSPFLCVSVFVRFLCVHIRFYIIMLHDHVMHANMLHILKLIVKVKLYDYIIILILYNSHVI